jgi:amino acid efflux transporter
MNVYVGASAKLAAALAAEGALPAWLAGGPDRSIPRRPLLALAVSGLVLLLGLGAGISSADDLIRATSACFVAVYVLALAAAVRRLTGRLRAAALAAFTLICVVAAFSSTYLLVPAMAALASAGLRAAAARRTAARPSPVALNGDQARR